MKHLLLAIASTYFVNLKSLLAIAKTMKFSVYGRKLEILRSGEKWKVFLLGSEGRKRVADDIVIPSHLKEDEVKRYLEDLLHEWATPHNK